MISILTPSWNYGRFIRDALDSVSLQGVAYEHLVADNLSADETVDVLSSRADPHLRWWSEADAGQSDALNRLLSKQGGDLVGWLNADEYYLPDAFRRVERAFSEHPEVDVVYGDTIFVDVDGKLQSLLSRHGPSSFVLRHRGCYISSCSTFIRSSALRGFSFDTGLRHVMDWDLYLHLQERGSRFHYVPVPLGAFRAHDERITAVATLRNSPEHVRVRERYGLTTQPRLWAAQRAAGDLVYRVRKILPSRTRERRARELAGAPTVWMRGEAAHDVAARLIRL